MRRITGITRCAHSPSNSISASDQAGSFSRGKSVQVGLIGGDPAIEFGATGYHEAQDADITAVSVTLKHLHSTKAFNPITLAEYGEQYIVNAFVQNAVEELAAKCHAEIAAIITAANFSAVQTVTAANYGYDDVVDINTDLSTAKASRQRALILNPSYIGALRKDAKLTSAFNTQGDNSVVRTGIVGRIGTLQVLQYAGLPNNGENLVGFAASKDAICIGTGSVWSASPNSGVASMGGLSVMVESEYTHGILYLTAAIRFGAAKGRANLKRVLSA